MAEHGDHIPPTSGGAPVERGSPAEHGPDGSGSAGSDAPAGNDGARKRSVRHRVLRTVAILLASAIGIVLTMLLLFVLALQTNWGGTHFADFLLTLANPFSDARSDYDELRGNFITSVEIHDLRLYRLDTVYVDTIHSEPASIRYVRKDSIQSISEYAAFDSMYLDTLQMVAVDTFRMRYNLLGLFTRTVDLREVYFANPVLRARQRADSTWDLLEPFGPSDTTTAGPAFTLKIGEVRVTDASLFAMYNPPDADSVLQVEDFNVRAGDFVIGSTTTGRLDTLYGAYMMPRSGYWTEVSAGGSLYDGGVNITGLTIESPYSHVTAAGRIQLPTDEPGDTQRLNFALNADPLALRDIRLFVPSLHPDRSATIDASVSGSTSEMIVNAVVDLADGGSLRVGGTVVPGAGDELQYDLTADVQALNPSFFTTPPGTEAGTLLTGDIDVDLRGTSAETLSGTANAHLVGSTVGGLELTEAVVASTIEDGRVAFDLNTNFRGSTITAEGSVHPFEEIPSYMAEGRTQNFNIASLTEGDQHSDLDVTFSVEGHGLDMATADLTADVQVQPSTVNRYRIDDGRVELTMVGGELSYGFRFLFPDGLLVANGDASLDDPVRYQIQRGRFENVDLAALLGQEVASSLNGDFTLVGVGTDPQTLSAEAALNMSPSVYGDYRLEEGRVQLDFENGRLEMVARADMAEAGFYNFAAYTRPFDDVPTFHVTRGEFTNVNVGALTGNPDQESDLSGTATFTSRGFDPETMVLNGTFTLAPSRFNDQAINSAQVAVDLAGGRAAFDAAMALPDGDLRLIGSARPFAPTPTYEVADGRFRNIDLSAFTGNASLQSSLNGTLSVAGTGFDPETMSVEGRIDFGESRLNQQTFTSASLAGRLEGGTADVELRLNVPEGQTQLSATVNPFLETPAYTVHEGTFSGINVAALSGNPDWQTNLSGGVSLSGEGFDAETMSAEGTITLRRSVVNDATIESGRISGTFSGGAAEFDAMLAFDSGSAEVSGSGNFLADVPDYQIEGRVTNVDPAAFLGADTVRTEISAVFELQGRGTDPRTMEIEGLLTSNHAVYEGAEVDTLHTDFAMRDGVLRVDSLLLRSSAADARGSGIIAVFDTTAVSDFEFVADLKDLRPVRELVGAQEFDLAEGRFEGRVYGRGDRLQFDVSGRFRNLVYNDIRLAEFDGTVVGEFGADRELTIAELDGRLEAISLPQFLVENAELRLEYQNGAVVFEGTVTIDERRYGDIAGRVRMEPDAQIVTLDSLNFHLDDAEWQLLQEATITYGDQIRISNLLLYSGDQQVAIDGVIDPAGTQNLVLTVESFEMGAVADLLGYEGLGGDVSGSLLLSGPAGAPDMEGTLNANLQSSGEAIGALRLALDYDSLRLNVDARLSHEDGSTMLASGFVPLDLRIAPPEDGGLAGSTIDQTVDLAITADSFSIGWIDPFLDPEVIDRFEGRLTGDVDVSGTISQPILDGRATLIDGVVGLAEFDVTYRDISANMDFRQNQVHVSELVIRSGDGSVTGEGDINLAELTLGEFDINLRADDFLAVDSRSYTAVVGGLMHLSGTTSQPLLEGDLEVVSAEFYLNEETTAADLEQVELTQEDLQTVEQRFGIRVTEADTTTFDLYNALAMDLSLNIDRDTWIRSRVNPVMDIQFTGRLDLDKPHFGDLQIFGTIDVVEQRSRIVQFGKRFNITSGTLTFNGPAGDPYIDIGAEYDARSLRGGVGDDVTITLSIEGRMSEQLDLTLGSDPPMEYSNIVSYIATGRPADASLQLGGQVLGAGTDLAFGQLTAMIEGVAGQRLGLDLVTIDLTGGTPTVTAGKYVGPRLFVSVSQPIGQTGDGTQATSAFAENTPVVTAEYEIRNWLLLRLIGGSSALRLNLLFEYAY